MEVIFTDCLKPKTWGCAWHISIFAENCSLRLLWRTNYSILGRAVAVCNCVHGFIVFLMLVCTISQVNNGLYLSEHLGTPLSYVDSTADSVSLNIIIPVVIGGLICLLVVGALIICCVVCWYHRKVRRIKSEQDWTNTITELELSNLRHKSE